jgi:hypothetical protein
MHNTILVSKSPTLPGNSTPFNFPSYFSALSQIADLGQSHIFVANIIKLCEPAIREVGIIQLLVARSMLQTAQSSTSLPKPVS